MKNIYIGIVFTAFQSMNLERIIANNDVDSSKLIIINTSTRKIGSKCLFELRSYISIFFAFQIIRLLYHIKIINISKALMAHPFNCISNYFFQIAKEINIIEDGIGNYFKANLSNLNKKYYYKVILKSILFFYKFKYDSLDFIPSDRKVSNGYFYSPEYAVFSGIKNKIFFKLNKLNKLNKKRIVFLDQHIDVVKKIDVVQKKALSISIKILNEYRKEGYEIIIKKHAEQMNCRHNFYRIFDEISPNYSILPIEEVVLYIQPAIVISFVSSGLVNIKREFPEIVCYSLGAENIKLDDKNTLADFFGKFSIENIPVK